MTETQTKQPVKNKPALVSKPVDARRQREVVLLLLTRTVCLRPVYLSAVYFHPFIDLVVICVLYILIHVYFLYIYCLFVSCIFSSIYYFEIIFLTNCPYCALPPPPPSPTSREGGSCSQSASEEIYLNFGKIIQRQYFQKYVFTARHPQIQG